MQHTVDALANANSKAALARMLVDERDRCASVTAERDRLVNERAQAEKDYFQNFEKQRQLAAEQLETAETTITRYQLANSGMSHELDTLRYQRDTLLRVLAYVLERPETKR